MSMKLFPRENCIHLLEWLHIKDEYMLIPFGNEILSSTWWQIMKITKCFNCFLFIRQEDCIWLSDNCGLGRRVYQNLTLL